MTISQPQAFWHDGEASLWDKRVVVTGGAGFLGSFVVEKLREQGTAHLFVPRKAEDDLRQHPTILDLLHDTNPDMIIHLAASVGGIGANREHPVEFFYDNLMMGVPLLHERALWEFVSKVAQAASLSWT